MSGGVVLPEEDAALHVLVSRQACAEWSARLVLVTLELKNPVIASNRDEWKKYLFRSISSNVKDMRMDLLAESFHKSTSTCAVLQILVSAAAYCCLGKLKPYAFTAYILSSDQFLLQPDNVEGCEGTSFLVLPKSLCH